MRGLPILQLGLPLGLAGIIAVASFAGEGSPYRFPQLLAVLLIFTAGVSALAWLREQRGAGPLEAKPHEFASLAPGLVYFVLYIALAQTLGFYLSSGLAMGAVLVHYALRQGRPSAGEWFRHGVFLVGFMLLIYALFNELLRVQTPRGWLF